MPEYIDYNILIVDDEENNIDMMKHILTREGYNNLFSANNGLEALQRFKDLDGNISIVTLDMVMPHMSGIEFLRELGNYYSENCVVVIAVTAYCFNEMEREFFSLGTTNVIAHEYILKPFNINEIILSINRAFEIVRAKEEKGPVDDTGDVKIKMGAKSSNSFNSGTGRSLNKAYDPPEETGGSKP